MRSGSHDELGYIPLSRTDAALLFEAFSQRYERGSTIVTGNLPFEDWTPVLGSERVTGALLDRLTYHVRILTMNADSYGCAKRQAAHSAGTKQSQANQKNIGPETDEITTDWSGTPPPIYKGLRPGPFENRRTTTALACFYSAPTAWNSTANDSNATSDASIEVERCEFTFGVNLRAPHTMHCLVLGLTEICDRPQAEI